ncbi:hypothetical protein [Sinomonas atrocyanea]|uniref:hypothetical protein n=1 Tax=Sinomonas atrocyanea TaxID=37927 RepID=UPI00285DF15D|nr:hypothetical protein [Sinomonas atrocyanea]MDR6622341.1 outer membrane lipoprotein-sorting protein [Sinomonas atrocyanea]
MSAIEETTFTGRPRSIRHRVVSALAACALSVVGAGVAAVPAATALAGHAVAAKSVSYVQQTAVTTSSNHVILDLKKKKRR